MMVAHTIVVISGVVGVVGDGGGVDFVIALAAAVVVIVVAGIIHGGITCHRGVKRSSL